MMAMLHAYSGRPVLALGAHPDDVEIGMGGTVARLGELGARVVIAVVCIPSQFEVRQREAQAACELLGAQLHLIGDGGSCRVEDMKGYELVAQLDGLLAQLQPAALFVHGGADHHRDHRLVYEAARASLRRGGIDAFCYQPCSCRPGPAPFAPRAFVNIGATLERKLAAVAEHHSQFCARGLDMSFLRDVARFYGHMAGVEHAEGLEVLQLGLA